MFVLRACDRRQQYCVQYFMGGYFAKESRLRLQNVYGPIHRPRVSDDRMLRLQLCCWWESKCLPSRDRRKPAETLGCLRYHLFCSEQ